MQLPDVQELVVKSRAKTIILLNAEWTDTKSVASRHGSFVASFETAYCFQPIAIQACPGFVPLKTCILFTRYSSSIFNQAFSRHLWMDCSAVPSRVRQSQTFFAHAMTPFLRCTIHAFKKGSRSAQAFVVSTTQGALFAQATQAGSPAGWQILKKGWGQSWKVIGKMQRRPTSQDLETAFYNASAAESPLTAGIKAVRQLVPGKKD